MDYIKSNKQFWNQNVESHMQSKFYDVESFLAGKTSLRDIELELLGNVKDKTILHLQCHFGQDTLSLQRMGAQCTGVDFSEQAILQAKKINSFLQLSATFICSDVFILPQIHEHEYDIVFTTYGTIGWLPNINQWAALVSKYLKPGGKLIFVEFHPFVWMYDNDFTKIIYNYFTDAPIKELEEGSYVGYDKERKATSITWNHSISQVMQALINNGLHIDHVQEYNYSPYNCFNQSKQIASQKYIIEAFEQKVPLVYSLVCSKTKL
jgi:ubiquinone/menaquinone biosynthesis C-methylase UbiE